MAVTKEPFRPSAPIVVELAAGAAIVRTAGVGPEVLLLHFASEDRWCLPKGHVEPGESLVAAAVREVREETGLAGVRIGDEIAEVTYRFYRPSEQRNVLKVSVYFLARGPDGPLRPEPIFDRAEWVPLDEARRWVPFETDRAVLAAARQALGA